MKDGYIKKSAILQALCTWWNNQEDTRSFYEAIRDIPGEDKRIAKPWNRVTDKLPVVFGSYMVTVLEDGVLSTHEAFFNDGYFFDPVEEWTRYNNVIAWSGMPEPYKPEG